MSLTTLEIMNGHRKAAVENSPASEEFTIVEGGNFKGIFDESHIENNKDSGNVTQKKIKPRIMVDSLPEELVNQERISKIQRENGEEYTYQFFGKDKEGIAIIWLV